MSDVDDVLPIFRVRTDGTVEELGTWTTSQRTLELVATGFPLLPPGKHVLEGELPWIFWDMSPSGFLGRRLAHNNPHLQLPTGNPRDWMARDVLTALTGCGGDLSGNLLIGKSALRAFETPSEDQRSDVAEALEEAMAANASRGSASSLGGERPKILIDGSEHSLLIKFSPLRDTPQGQRWQDLLTVEAHAAATLRHVGVSAVTATATTAQRTLLSVVRFDRLPHRGRVATGSLYFLARERWGDLNVSAPEVLRRLHAEGVVDADSAETCRRVHAFSAAIGNDDAHLGNYSLLFRDDATARLAPIYDVLPMSMAPRNDELPDPYLRPLPAPEPEVRLWVEHLAERVRADPAISDAFKRLWLGRLHT